MSAPSSTVFQFNFKIGGDLHNVYAENGTEAIELLEFFEESILPVLTSLSQKIGAVTVVAQSPLTVAPAATQTLAAQPPAQSDAEDGHSCPHGPMRLVPAGVSKKTGKPYRAFYSCTVQGSGCPTVAV